jgi:hypothetical protein
MIKNNYSLIGSILAITVFIIGFIGPWYSISGEFLGVKTQIDVGLTETSISSGTDSNSIITSIDRTEVDNTMYLVILTIILSIITLIGILSTYYGLGNMLLMQKIGEVIGFITFILAIMTVLYYIFNIPDTSDLDAIGLNTGLGWGFGLFLFGGVIIFITNVWSRITRQEK